LNKAVEDLDTKFDNWVNKIQHSCVTVMDSFILPEQGIKLNTKQIQQLDNNQE
jgi:hypothetical protein